MIFHNCKTVMRSVVSVFYIPHKYFSQKGLRRTWKQLAAPQIHVAYRSHRRKACLYRNPAIPRSPTQHRHLLLLDYDASRCGDTRNAHHRCTLTNHADLFLEIPGTFELHFVETTFCIHWKYRNLISEVRSGAPKVPNSWKIRSSLREYLYCKMQNTMTKLWIRCDINLRIKKLTKHDMTAKGALCHANHNIRIAGMPFDRYFPIMDSSRKGNRAAESAVLHRGTCHRHAFVGHLQVTLRCRLAQLEPRH